MTKPRLVVLDSSVGVKWMKPEPGSERCLALLEEHRDGATRIVVAALFVHELLAVAVRHGGPELGGKVWGLLEDAELTVIALDEALAGSALGQCQRLGCSFYDALAPALASQLGATLYSADRRAHGRFDGAVLL
jgi:predicted nucleic acid-binding protein